MNQGGTKVTLFTNRCAVCELQDLLSKLALHFYVLLVVIVHLKAESAVDNRTTPHLGTQNGLCTRQCSCDHIVL